MTKAQWRRWAAERPSTPDSDALRARLVALPEWDAARAILLFAALPGEPDLSPLVDDPTRRFFLPRCGPRRTLTIHPYAPGDPLVTGPFGLREPDTSHAPPIDPIVLDLVVAPSVLLSEACERLGHGAGYYDRFLPTLRPDCVVVGVQSDRRIVPALPIDPWDRLLDVVLSDLRIFRRGAGGAEGAMV